MKIEAWIAAYLASTTAAAIGPTVPGKPARPAGRPEKLENWKWKDPFAAGSSIDKFEPFCSSERTFKVKEYLLDDVSEPPPRGIEQFASALKEVFADRQYPGSWDGVDPHGYDRNLLQMEYADVPVKVREWIEEQERSNGPGKGLFAVYGKPEEGTKVRATMKVPEMPIPRELRTLDKQKTVIFAPGAVYEALPLWVAEDSDCADLLSDLSTYSATPADGGVVAYPVEKTRAKRGQGKRDAEFKVKAQVLKAKAKPAEESKAEEPVAAKESGAPEKETKDEL